MLSSPRRGRLNLPDQRRSPGAFLHDPCSILVGPERRSARLGSSPPGGGLPYEAPSGAGITQDSTAKPAASLRHVITCSSLRSGKRWSLSDGPSRASSGSFATQLRCQMPDSEFPVVRQPADCLLPVPAFVPTCRDSGEQVAKRRRHGGPEGIAALLPSPLQ